MSFLISKATELLKHEANSTPFYVDFQPPCDWRSHCGSETLVLYLPEFKKDQLKIQISNMKTLTISGERNMDEAKSSRFCKKITVPDDCNAMEIQAKFVDGLLQIKMPKKNSFSDVKQEQISKDKTSSQLANQSQEKATELRNSSNEEGNVEKKIDLPSKVTNTVIAKDENINSFSRFKSYFNMAMSVAVVTVVVAGLGALIFYSCLFLLA